MNSSAAEIVDIDNGLSRNNVRVIIVDVMTGILLEPKCELNSIRGLEAGFIL